MPNSSSARGPKAEPLFDWTTYAREFGVRVRALREARELTQEQLAGLAGIERSQLQNIERNRTSAKGHPANPQLLNVFRLAWALQVPPAVLLPELDGPPQAHYGPVFDATWPTIEAQLRADWSSS
ncbi:helix-turn-helix domain-containing protein [Rarobacter incanus]|uniref:Helix-turn-helix protein n=1 Tax=Rarobacter incanus TaxID=153494 RepID=A0A542SPV0_9MICO|nr:helix-turn-helix transcriptional regulator [Rarobacter incanus]TQK76636.1 helix-turn-helix protein [Rarobacter incanus]